MAEGHYQSPIANGVVSSTTADDGKLIKAKWLPSDNHIYIIFTEGMAKVFMSQKLLRKVVVM